ncbi:MAG: hypothetical protein U1E56_13270 [Bauldia sp.]
MPQRRSRLSAILLAAAVVPYAGSALAACDTCVIQTKVPSTKEAGKFDYRLACIELESGDELLWFVTAATDEEATAMGIAECGPWRT